MRWLWPRADNDLDLLNSKMANHYNESAHGEHMLDDLDTDVTLLQAGASLRFTNYLVDHLLLYLFIRFVGTPVFAAFFGFIGFYVESTLSAWLIWLGIRLFVSCVFYTCFECFAKGKTPGKLVTGTRTVKEDGHRLDFKTTLLRTLCRMVPIDVFTAFGDPSYPWHDRWSKTVVVVDRYSLLPAEK